MEHLKLRQGDIVHAPARLRYKDGAAMATLQIMNQEEARSVHAPLLRLFQVRPAPKNTSHKGGAGRAREIRVQTLLALREGPVACLKGPVPAPDSRCGCEAVARS